MKGYDIMITIHKSSLKSLLTHVSRIGASKPILKSIIVVPEDGEVYGTDGFTVAMAKGIDIETKMLAEYDLTNQIPTVDETSKRFTIPADFAKRFLAAYPPVRHFPVADYVYIQCDGKMVTLSTWSNAKTVWMSDCAPECGDYIPDIKAALGMPKRETLATLCLDPKMLTRALKPYKQGVSIEIMGVDGKAEIIRVTEKDGLVVSHQMVLRKI